MDKKQKTKLIIGAIVWVALVIVVALGAMLVQILNENEDDVDVNEPEASAYGVGGEDLSELYEKQPILKELPMRVDYFTDGYAKRVKYTISYKLSDDLKEVKIVIKDETGGNYEAALEKLRAKGAKLEDYEIEYVEIKEAMNGKAF